MSAARLLIVATSVEAAAAASMTGIESVLTGAGYSVRMAGRLEEALGLLRSEPPDLILLDPPAGQGGPDVCRLLREAMETGERPILLFVHRDALSRIGEDGGADDFVAVPAEPSELLARVRALLHGRGLQRRLDAAGSFYLDLFSKMSAVASPASPFRLDEDLARILSHALDAVGARRGRLLLLDPHRNRLEVAAAAGEGMADALQVGTEVPEGPPPPGLMRIPIVGNGEPLGAVEIDLRDLPAPAPDREKLLHVFAAQAAMFLQNIRLDRDVRRMFLDIIVSLAGAIDAKDAYTHGHTVRVARVSLMLAKEAGLTAVDRESLLLASLLHDVGKIGVPDAVLKKPAPLSEEETAVMREHPVIGAQILRHIRALRHSLPGIRHHHEHWDGTGYPDHLAGEAIPESARIILVADAFDAMTSDRVYRKGMPIRSAIDRMASFAGSQFDPAHFESLRRLCHDGAIRSEDCRETPDLFSLLRSGV